MTALEAFGKRQNAGDWTIYVGFLFAQRLVLLPFHFRNCLLVLSETTSPGAASRNMGSIKAFSAARKINKAMSFVSGRLAEDADEDEEDDVPDTQVQKSREGPGPWFSKFKGKFCSFYVTTKMWQGTE